MPSCGVCLCSVCPCVCHVRELCQNEYRYLWNFFTIGQPHHSSFTVPNGREPPSLSGASNAGGVGINRVLSLYACCWRCNRRGVVTIVADGRRPPSRKLWHLYRRSYTAGIRPSATRDKVTVSVVLQRESDQAGSRTIHNHDRSCVWQEGLTLRWRQQNRIKLYALVNPKLK